MSTTPRETPAQKLKRLEAENARLRGELDSVTEELRQRPTLPLPGLPTDAVAEPAVKVRRKPGRTIASVVLIVIATLLAPIALVANAAQRQFLDTEAFVATVAPLIEDPEVQEFLIDEITLAIQENVDVAGLTNDLFDGLQTLELPPRALDALDQLRAPAVTGIQNLIQTVVTSVIESEQFHDAFAQALRLAHSQLIATLEGDEDAAVTINGNGTIGLQLGPIVDAVKQRLLDRGITLAQFIPEVDRTITLAQSDQVTRLITVYQFSVALGLWLPWIVLALYALAVIVAKRRSVALVASGLSLAGVAAIVGIALGVGRFYAVNALSPTVPRGASDAIYDAIASEAARISLVLAVLGLSIALVAALAAPWEWSRSARGSVDRLADASRESAQRRGLSTGAFGVFLAKWRLPIRIAIGVIAGALLLFVRPLSPAFIIWTAIIALLVVVILRFLERPVPVSEPAVA